MRRGSLDRRSVSEERGRLDGPGIHRGRALLLTALVAIATLGTDLRAQEPAEPERIVAIHAGRLIDVAGGRVVENATIVVRGERIETVGPGVRVPRGADVIDLSGHTVLPGLIDMHTHLTGDPSGGYADQALHRWPGYSALVGAKNARITLQAGFTTVRDIGAGDWADVALRDAINDGIVPGPRMYVAANAIGITGGHCDVNGFRPDLMDEPGPRQGIANGEDEVVEAVRYAIKYGADVIKFCATGGVLSAGDAVGVQQFTEAEMRALVATARMAERRVAAHAHGTEGIKAAVRAGVASIEHGSILDDEAIRLMKEHGTYLVPTLMPVHVVTQMAREGQLAPWSAAKALEIAPQALRSVETAIAAGVPIAFGTDAGTYPHGRNAEEFGYLVEAGLSPMQAIQAATLHAARLLGRESELGALEAGRLADIIAVRGDPLADVALLQSIDFVMQGGVVHKGPGSASRVASQ